MGSLRPTVQWLPIIPLIFFLTVVSTTHFSSIPPHFLLRKTTIWEAKMLPKDSSNDFQTFYYNQTLDHFNYGRVSHHTFRQKYVINFKYWGGANAGAPIFVFLGGEAAVDNDIDRFGFFLDNARRFNPLLVYIEHRYYGESIPFGSREKAMGTANARGFFNSAQTLADYAEVILYLKKKFGAKDSPVIVAGTSYGGMLAAWFRLKYPHVAHGALASSAPILYFEDITPSNGYYSVVTKVFKKASENCYHTIKKSWREIDRIASTPNGLKTIGQRFKTCQPLNQSSDLKNYLSYTYAALAQYNDPPVYPVNLVCHGIDTLPKNTDILDKIFSGLVEMAGNKSCYNVKVYDVPSESTIGWSWQTCSEMVMPIGHDENDTMFPANHFELKSFIKECKDAYGIRPRPHWITTYYGGHDIKFILKKFASNIIFGNGLSDPYSSGSVTESLSDTLVAVNTVKGSHRLDILRAQPNDPEWLTMQRKIEVNIVDAWLSQYYADLLTYQQ